MLQPLAFFRISAATGLVAAAAVQFSPSTRVSTAPAPAATAENSSMPTSTWLDLDGDKLQDTLVVTPEGKLRLLTARPDGSFFDATQLAGLEQIAGARFALFQDYDGDSRQDLFVGTIHGSAVLLHGQVGGTFVDVTAQSGMKHSGSHVAARWLDVDADGRVDLHVRTQSGEHLYRNTAAGVFEAVALANYSAVGLPASGGNALPTPADANRTTPASETAPPGATDQASGPFTEGRRAVAELTHAGSGPGGLRDLTQPLVVCASSVQDQTTTLCVEADSTPTLGKLLPLSTDFNLLPNGNVGMGTTNAQDRLHVQDGDMRVSGTAGREMLLLDGDGANAIRLDASANGTSNSIEVYRDGALAIDHLTGPNGYLQRFFNTVNGIVAYSGGTSQQDASGMLLLREGAAGVTTVRLDADQDELVNGVQVGLLDLRSSGTGGTGGRITLGNNDGAARLRMNGGTSAGGSSIDLQNGAGSTLIELDANPGNFGAELNLFNDEGFRTLYLDSDTNNAGQLQLFNGTSSTTATIHIDGDGTGNDGGVIELRAADGSKSILIDGNSTSNGGLLSIRDSNGSDTFVVTGDDGSDSSRALWWNRMINVSTVVVEALDGVANTGSRILMTADNGGETVQIDGEDSFAGQIVLSEDDGSMAWQFLGNSFTMYNAAGVATQNYNRVTGSKSGVLSTTDYGQRLMYCVESPEIWFEDFGSAQLVNGRARIDLDPVLLQTVTIDEQHPMKVFVTLNGESDGVYVEKSNDHFVVIERGGGSGNVSFDWRMVAKRKGLENARLDPFIPAESGANSDFQRAPKAPATEVAPQRK